MLAKALHYRQNCIIHLIGTLIIILGSNVVTKTK